MPTPWVSLAEIIAGLLFWPRVVSARSKWFCSLCQFLNSRPAESVYLRVLPLPSGTSRSPTSYARWWSHDNPPMVDRRSGSSNPGNKRLRIDPCLEDLTQVFGHAIIQQRATYLGDRVERR